MAKILVIAQGEYIADYATQVRNASDDPDNMEIVVAHMEDAVRLARRYVGTDTEVFIARSISAKMIRQAKLPIPVVEIPISNEEILRSLRRAQKIAPPDAPIGFLGFRQAVSAIKPFLDMMGNPITIYDVVSTEQSLAQIEQAKKDGIAVLIAGARSVHFIELAGLPSILIDTSLESVSAAYTQAREILMAIAAEKKKTRETTTILNSVSDGIVSVGADFRLTMINRVAASLFEQESEKLVGADFDRLFRPQERTQIRRALQSGEESIGEIVERRGVKYAMRVTPVVVDKAPEGVVVTLQEISALQKVEASVRQGLLYERGNAAQYEFADIKGGSPAIRDAIATAEEFARLQSNVLIIGETGTGKELFAQSIHNAGPRRDRPFVAVNCGAIPPNLVESELFGYEEGAFTGSKKGGRMGLFELAHNGTIFLDEISEMDQAGQVNLLRALQERQIRRVGGASVIPVDVRVIAASNADLYDMVRNNRFRRDLYYRLSVLVINLPPLRARGGDISVLARHFVGQFAAEFGKSTILADEALAELETFAWEGNIRQLRNFCERIVAVARRDVLDGEFIRKMLGESFFRDDAPAPEPVSPHPASAASGDADEVVVMKGRPFRRSHIESLLARRRGNRERVAAELGVSRTTLWKHLKRWDAEANQST